jgi:hypothetical protein
MDKYLIHTHTDIHASAQLLSLARRKWEVQGLSFCPEARCLADLAGSYLEWGRGAVPRTTPHHSRLSCDEQ